MRLLLHGPGDLTAGTPDHDRALEGLLDYAAEARAECVVYHGLNYFDPCRLPGERALRGFAGRAEALGLILAIENLAPVHPGPPRLCHDPLAVRDLVRTIDSPAVGLLLDLGHAHITCALHGTDIADILRAVRDDVVLFHVPRGACDLCVRMERGGHKPPIADLARLARQQHGVVALRQLRELGWTRARVDGELRRGRLVRVEHRVYAVGHHPLGARTRWMAAVLALCPGAVLSHISAAMLWGLMKQASAPSHVTSRNRAKTRGGLIAHHTTSLTNTDHTARDHIPVTTIPRTAIDLADVLSPPAYAQAIEQIPLLDARAIRRALDRHPGRVANGPLAQMLELYDGADRTRRTSSASSSPSSAATASRGRA